VISGILLIGGAGKRFGSPKALARLPSGETLAERAWATLAWCDERIAVGKEADALPLPFPVADDGADVRAPIAGVVGGLQRAANDLCVVLPVDMPLVREEDLRALADACEEAAVPQTGPLPGAYRRTALPELERRLANGELALWGAVAAARVVELEPSRLANVNTPADLAGLG
jgi:molybdopterin-guanine dinucleotide biosynthesis protein A